jgi:hypothetical protein
VINSPGIAEQSLNTASLHKLAPWPEYIVAYAYTNEMLEHGYVASHIFLDAHGPFIPTTVRKTVLKLVWWLDNENPKWCGNGPIWAAYRCDQCRMLYFAATSDDPILARHDCEAEKERTLQI